MDFVCAKTDLLHGVQTVSKAIPSSTSESVLLNILLKAEDEGKSLSLFATDNRISIRQKLPIKMEMGGELSVPGGLFSDILQSIQTVTAEEVRLSTSEDNKIEISSEDATYNITGTDPRSFPLIPSPEGDIEFTMTGDLLRNTIRQVAVTASAGPGVAQGYDKALMEAKDGILTTVTTDTVRLAVRKEKIENLPDFEIMVPIHALQELYKVLTPAADVKVLISDDQISFTFGETEFQARLCEHEFPDYRKIIPKEHSRTFGLDAKDFTNAIKGVLPVARENKNKVHLELKDSQLVVTAQSHEGRARRQLAADIAGEEIELAFNAKFILDFLAVTDAKKVTWGVTSSIHPATIEPIYENEAKDEKSYLYLLMPINI